MIYSNIIVFLSALVIGFFLNGCGISSTSEGEEGNLFQYQETLIGNNNDVVSILTGLRHSEEFQQVELETASEPYGMTVSYKGITAQQSLEQEYKETALYNASYLFTLIENADWITFDFENQQYTLHKDKVEEVFGKDLSEYSQEEELEKLVEDNVQDENSLNEFFSN